MNLSLPSRRAVLMIGTVLLGIALIVGLPWLSPTRGAERAWQGTLSALADNDLEKFGSYLDSNYHDGFGLDRAGAVALAKTVRGQFLLCTITREQPELVMDPGNHGAISRALIRLGGQGSPVASAAIQASATSTTPTIFRWRRGSWKPWDWKLIALDNAEAAKAVGQLQHELNSFGAGMP
ncbi:MAG: hypothetical protein RIQ79_2486 [Verrucomicrobiota bacterium]